MNADSWMFSRWVRYFFKSTPQSRTRYDPYPIINDIMIFFYFSCTLISSLQSTSIASHWNCVWRYIYIWCFAVSRIASPFVSYPLAHWIRQSNVETIAKYGFEVWPFYLVARIARWYRTYAVYLVIARWTRCLLGSDYGSVEASMARSVSAVTQGGSLTWWVTCR